MSYGHFPPIGRDVNTEDLNRLLLDSELKESDFDVLRGRDDFKKLLVELETRNKAKAAKKQAASK